MTLMPVHRVRRTTYDDANNSSGQHHRQGDSMKSGRERAEEKRAEKLEVVREQVKSGSLVIRQMTEEERRRFPPRPARPKRRVRW